MSVTEELVVDTPYPVSMTHLYSKHKTKDRLYYEGFCLRSNVMAYYYTGLGHMITIPCDQQKVKHWTLIKKFFLYFVPVYIFLLDSSNSSLNVIFANVMKNRIEGQTDRSRRNAVDTDSRSQWCLSPSLSMFVTLILLLFSFKITLLLLLKSSGKSRCLISCHDSLHVTEYTICRNTLLNNLKKFVWQSHM